MSAGGAGASMRAQIVAPFQGAGHFFAQNPGVSLRSTPGYGLASLRDEPGNENVARTGALVEWRWRIDRRDLMSRAWHARRSFMESIHPSARLIFAPWFVDCR